MKKYLLLPLLFLLISCTFSSENEEKNEKAVLPTLILERASYSLGQQNQNPIEIQGEKITFYSEENRAELEEFEFKQTNENGEKILEGRANSGSLNTSTKEMVLKGNVSLVQLEQGMEISAEEIYFDSEKEEISADGQVVVKSRSGDFSGVGFKGDLKLQVYSFEKLEEGWMDN